MKLTIEKNFTIVLRPGEPTKYIRPQTTHPLQHRAKEERWAAEALEASARRHLDNASVELHRDIVDVCSFCERTWEVWDGTDPEFPAGMPACCEKAIEEWRATQQAA